MDIVGWVAIAVVALIVLVAIVLGLTSIPDARRLMRIRRM
jgi:hypothetical protein